MTKQPTLAATPLYVLRSDNQTFSPTITSDEAITDCVCIYGFSDKPIYDQFIKSTDQLLTPYPLVGGYLENRIEEEAATGEKTFLRLIILDATDISQKSVSAATMAAVLSAQQEKNDQTPIDFELTFDPATSSYTMQDNSGGSESVETSRVVKS
ncbi:hypothetical protein OAG71_00875 [bacterium]|nr:hypothetical protein [bacterium]